MSLSSGKQRLHRHPNASACFTYNPPVRILGGMFVASGFCGVAYQVLLARYLHLIVGGTTYAVSALLVAFLIGNSVGALIGGWWADRSTRPLRVYAIAEAAVGVYSLAFPFVFGWLQDVYVAIAPPPGEEMALRHGVRFLVGIGAFVIPSAFMGMTTPAFARAVPRADQKDAWLARIYSWNTLGAAMGALAAAYILVPVFGVRVSMVLLALVNLVVFVLAFVTAPICAPATGSRATAVEPRLDRPADGIPLGPLMALAAATGFLCFSLEVIWTHLLALLLSNSVYAFGLMLGSLLLGLGGGAVVARRLATPLSRARISLAASLILCGLTVVLTLGVWERVPSVFLALAKGAPTFAALEMTRFAVALALMATPTLFLGTCFPLVLCLASAHSTRVGSRVGRLIAVNTIGAVAGALVAPYLLLNTLGSLASLQWLVFGLLGVGALALLTLSELPLRRGLALGTAIAAAGVAVFPMEWDFRVLGSAASIYFGSSDAQGGNILYRREDASGGLTTVVERLGVKTLLTNGKFQGDDGEEIPVQHRLSHIPMLFTPQRERALVIGLGTGVTLAAVAAHGFREVVCAEISPSIIEAARQHFGAVNGHVLDSPSVRVLEEDGRSVLLEDPRRYDVVSVEITTPWFAGVGNIYSEEFYRLVRSRLRHRGVLLQWFPVHHLSTRNVYVVLNTVRAVFPHVSVWTYRHQGFVVASLEPLAFDLESIRADLRRETLGPYVRDLDSGSLLELASDLVLTDDDVDTFLDSLAPLLQADRSLTSTDVWPTIEYETPKDVLDHLAYFQNRAVFRRSRSARPFPFRGQPTARESAVTAAAFARGWQDPMAPALIAARLAASSEPSELAARWVTSELAERGGLRGTEAATAVRDLAGDLPALSLLSSRAGTPECLADDSGLDPLVSVPLTATAYEAEITNATTPLVVTDGNASPALGDGWVVRGAPRRISLNLRLDRPRKLGAIRYSVRSLDAPGFEVQVFIRDEKGAWYPTAGLRETGGCTGARSVRLASSENVSEIRLEFTPDQFRARLAIHEVWVEDRP